MTTIPDHIAARIASEPTRRLTTAALIAAGYAPDDQAARAAIKRIRDLRAARSAARPGSDPLIRAASDRTWRLARIREDRANRAEIAAILAHPIATHWRADRRAAIAAFHHFPEHAEALAIGATLEAVTRLATTKWGWTRRHTSQSRAGRASSRYLRREGIGELRLSDHDIPVYGEREDRYARTGGPRWGEIIIGSAELRWSLSRWRREMILRAAGRR